MPRINKETETLGERLKKQRDKLELGIQDVAQEVQAPVKFVQALEEDRYEIFPAKVYAVGFLKKISEALRMENREDFIREFSNEWDVRMFRKQKEFLPLPENRGDEPLLTPARLGLGLGGVLLVLFLAFMGMRLTKFLGTPGLELEEPKDQAIYYQPLVRVSGKTEKESRLTVNGREIRIDELGFFDQELEFAAGIHVLEFVARNRFDKEGKAVRNIIIR